MKSDRSIRSFASGRNSVDVVMKRELPDKKDSTLKEEMKRQQKQRKVESQYEESKGEEGRDGVTKVVFDLKNNFNPKMIESPNQSLMDSVETSQEDEFQNPGNSNLENKSALSIKSNNKSEYNRNLLRDYAKDQGLIGKLGGKSDNLDDMNHQDELGVAKNSILVNYLGRGRNKWAVEKNGELSQNQFGSNTQETRLTKGIWGNEFGENQDRPTSQFASTNMEPTRKRLPMHVQSTVQTSKSASRRGLAVTKDAGSNSMIKQFMKDKKTANNTNFKRLENLPQMKAIDISNPKPEARKGSARN